MSLRLSEKSSANASGNNSQWEKKTVEDVVVVIVANR